MEKEKTDIKQERRKLIGIILIMLILITYVVMLLGKLSEQQIENEKQERVEKILDKLEHELNKSEK